MEPTSELPCPEADKARRPESGTRPRPESDKGPRPAADTRTHPESGTRPRPAAGTRPHPESGTRPRPESGTRPRPAADKGPRPEADKALRPEVGTCTHPEDTRPAPAVAATGASAAPGTEAPTPPEGKAPPARRPIVLLALAHACVDLYQGAVAALVPFFVAERAYTYAAASGVVLAASLLSSVVQPVFGALTDRWAMPWLLPVSTLVGGIGVALAGLTGSYALTLAVVGLSGIGVAAYHPEAARVARRASRGSHAAMSWFSLGGNLGFATAPLLVSAIAASGGLGASPLLVVPALAGAVLCVAALRGVKAVEAATPKGVHREPGADDWPSFLRLSGAIVCRSIVFVGLGAFISLYARQRTGGGEAAGTAALFVLYIGGALGTVAGGRLAALFGRVPVVRWSYALTVPAVAGVVLVPGPLFHVFVLLTSAGLYVPFSLHITLGQDFLPRRVGTAGGVTLGLTVSVGGLASPLIGALADATSLRTALAPLIALPALGWLLLRTLREPDGEAPRRA